MKSRGLPVALATALMLAAALPSSAANGYDGGFVKTVDRISVAEQSDRRSEGFYQVRDRGKGGHGGRGHHRGGKHHGHRRDHGYSGRHGRHGHYAPRYRYYGGSHRRYRDYYYDDYLGAFILGGALGYLLSDGYYLDDY